MSLPDVKEVVKKYSTSKEKSSEKNTIESTEKSETLANDIQFITVKEHKVLNILNFSGDWLDLSHKLKWAS